MYQKGARALNTSISATAIAVHVPEGPTFGAPLRNGQIKNGADSSLTDNSQQTDTSTDADTDHKNQLHGVQHEAVMVNTVDQSKSKSGYQKTLRRLAQNRKAARKSRLRKKAYVQQLESSQLRLSEIDQELQKARQQGIFITSGLSGDHGHTVTGNAALAFDMEYGRWLDEHQRLINDLRLAADVFHMLSGMWKTPAERYFMWLGGFRSSELMKQQVQDGARGQKREPFNRMKQNKHPGPQNFGNYTSTGWGNQSNGGGQNSWGSRRTTWLMLIDKLSKKSLLHAVILGMAEPDCAIIDQDDSVYYGVLKILGKEISSTFFPFKDEEKALELYTHLVAHQDDWILCCLCLNG
ncbi:hypothetical protein GOBAR_DD34121 [Gossypium barbadense]|nr:hypothetical protein GOBAR_DD34121 [Gossypium barbadense]